MLLIFVIKGAVIVILASESSLNPSQFCVILGKYALNSKLLSSRQSTETVESTTLWTSGMGPKT